ncbi:Competence domain-containing protein [Pseudomonas chlororaphis]|uniref:hypothetical protein n=1 Tax=Pseudomonas chlororaphis TaxID=587753 RepID=UPI0039E2E4DA
MFPATLKNPYIATIGLWIGLIALAYVTSIRAFAAASILMTGLIPFILSILWIGHSEVGTSLREQFQKKWHLAMMLTTFAFIYTLFAKQWAAAFINNIFHVDASHLGITYTLLVVLYAPFGLLYQPIVINNLWATMIGMGMIWGSILPLLLVLPVKLKTILKVAGVSFLIIFLFSFFIGGVSRLPAEAKSLTTAFALWADFNSQHLCTDSWATGTESVLFLGGDRVLVYQASNPLQPFQAQTCNFAKAF